jgi:hypothetical protein
MNFEIELVKKNPKSDQTTDEKCIGEQRKFTALITDSYFLIASALPFKIISN